MLKFMQPSSSSLFDCHNPIEIKYITRIRLELTHLREHKFKHSFQDTLNPICNYGIESAIHSSSAVPYIVKNVTHSSAIQATQTIHCQIIPISHLHKPCCLEIPLLTQKKTQKLLTWPLTLFCQLRDLMSHFYQQYFFLSCPFNNDSSDNKRILSEASPVLLGHQ